MQTSGAMRRENAKSYSTVIVRLVRNCALGRTIQYSRDSNDGIDRLRRTGCPAFAEHDAVLLGPAPRSTATSKRRIPAIDHKAIGRGSTKEVSTL